MSKAAIAMSGGVDSSVAAALAVEKYGKENVFGVTMKLFCYADDAVTDKSCCSLDAINDAADVCKQLGISHYVLNLENEFEKEIINNFVSEYERGRTPNPCVRCNSQIKFRYLLKKALDLGAETLVTGHYSQIVEYSSSEVEKLGPDSSQLHSNNKTFHLLKGKDVTKDQSYFLYNLNQDQMKHIWFPLGELTKQKTRKLAEKYDLKTAQKTESQDICFVATTTKDFLTSRVMMKSGNIIDKGGKILGKHDGLPLYTIGQRKGLGGGFSEPMYVTGINVKENEVIVGREEELYDDGMMVGNVTWTNEPPTLPDELDVKIRYNSGASLAILTVSFATHPVISTKAEKSAPGRSLDVARDDIIIKFKRPQKAITPGQTAVFYRGKEVVGGGVILST